MTEDLFADEFALAAVEVAEAAEQKKAVAIARKKAKTHTRRANSEAHLAEILPPLEMGNSYHVISRGDIDSMSYLVFTLQHTGPIERLTLSTWCLAMPDVEEIQRLIESGMVGHCHLCVGEIFPSQYGDEYEEIRKLELAGRVRVTVARNHSKVMIGSAPEAGTYFAIESSANINTNPRIEQTAIHMDRDLHDFYVEFFDGLKDIDARSKLKTAA